EATISHSHSFFPLSSNSTNMHLLFLLTYMANMVWSQMYVRTDTTFIPLTSLDVDLIQCSRICEKDPACVGFFVDTSRCTNLASGDYHPVDVVSFRKAGSLGPCPAGTKRWQMVFGTDPKRPKPDQSPSSGTTAFTTQGNGEDSGAKTVPSTTTGAPSTATTMSDSGPGVASEGISGASSPSMTTTSVQSSTIPVDNAVPSTGTTDGNGVKIRSEPSGGTSSPFPTTTSIPSTSTTSSSPPSINQAHAMTIVSLGDILSSTMTTSGGTDGGAKEVTDAVSGIGSTHTVRTSTATPTGATSDLPTTTVDQTTATVLTTTTRAQPISSTGSYSVPPTITPTTPASTELSAVADSTPSQTTMITTNGSITTNGNDETTMQPCVPCPKKGRGIRLYVPTSIMITPVTCNYCPVVHP
ncbi:hypothetical protein PRIPAC_84194, partial [Pristionchus pacificus]|uniref:Uncharacterized protein n=1 Tax=Pristionchus pacificus TaxID=54126 RepID=A0A2A6BUZ7_PRIPA